MHYGLILEMIGTIAFASSGAMTGIKKNMDIFGIIVLAVVTALGGGIIRDVILGNSPPKMFSNYSYTLVAITRRSYYFCFSAVTLICSAADLSLFTNP